VPGWLSVQPRAFTGFVGTEKAPTPLAQAEVTNIEKFTSAPAPPLQNQVFGGEAIKITDGPFADFLGKFTKLMKKKGKLKFWFQSSAGRRRWNWTSSKLLRFNKY
jgi:transcription antitermination factor NusG